ncbi:MAG: phosphate/phosphite/phosphonate ABC transporter substrate-binding protein [Massilia sp.]
MLACVLLLAACNKAGAPADLAPRYAASPAKPKIAEYTLGVTPMSNFRDIYDVFQPIVDHINAGLTDARLVLEVPRGLAEHDQQLQARHFAFALSNPYHTWRAAQHGGYHIFAKMGDDAAFRGIWIVRRDSGIESLADLKGKKVSFPPQSALAATMMTQLQLKESGIDPRRDIQASYVGSQHASIMAVYHNSVAAGATWPLAWITFQRLHPREAQLLEVRFPTPPLVNQGIVARDDVPPELVRQVGRLMLAMRETPRGRALLAQVPVSGFEAAGNAEFDVVRSFMEKYQHTLAQGTP